MFDLIYLLLFVHTKRTMHRVPTFFPLTTEATLPGDPDRHHQWFQYEVMVQWLEWFGVPIWGTHLRYWNWKLHISSLPVLRSFRMSSIRLFVQDPINTSGQWWLFAHDRLPFIQALNRKISRTKCHQVSLPVHFNMAFRSLSILVVWRSKDEHTMSCRQSDLSSLLNGDVLHLCTGL